MAEDVGPPSSSTERKAVLVRPKQFKAWLPLYLSKTDATISHINRLLSTPSGIDSVLCSVSYTLVALTHSAESLRLSLDYMSTTRIAQTSSKPPVSLANIISPTATAPIRAFASHISDIRIFLRLWGLLSIYAWARSVFVTDTPHDRTLRLIAYAQVAVNTSFQALENAAYLAQHGILRGWSAKRQTRAWVWSCRFWMAHTVLDLGKLWRLRTLQLEARRREEEGEHPATVGEEKMGDEMTQKEDQARVREEQAWWSAVLVNLAYAPLTVHYSLEQGFVGETWVGLFGSVAGWAGLRQAWRNTA